MLLFVSLPFGYKAVWHQQMVKYSALNDRKDGTENLLVLKGNNRYEWDTNAYVYVKYLDDGSILIKATSGKR